jgi:hypothetical protein
MPSNEHCTTGRPEEWYDCSTVATKIHLGETMYIMIGKDQDG